MAVFDSILILQAVPRLMPLVGTMLQFSKRARKIKITVKRGGLRKFVRWHGIVGIRPSAGFPEHHSSAQSPRQTLGT
jgi:hypothetical protein